MTFTYKFYDKAEDAQATDIMSFEGSSEQEVREAIHEYCSTYGYEAYTLIEDKPKTKKPAKAEGHYTAEQVANLIQTNDKVLYGALKNLYAQQTADEKVCKTARKTNGVGFNKYDAEFLSSAAEFLNRTGFLTERQKFITRKKLVKYNKQLTRLANELWRGKEAQTA